MAALKGCTGMAARQSGKAYGYLHTDPLEGGKYIQWEGGMGEGSAYPLHTHVE